MAQLHLNTVGEQLHQDTVDGTITLEKSRWDNHTWTEKTGQIHYDTVDRTITSQYSQPNSYIRTD